ncbi:MAG: hypothetical protein R3Y05_01605 [bacterium]
MNENQLEDGISITELFAIVWKRKIIIGIATVLTAILFMAFVVFGVNPNSLRYTSTFDMYFPGIVENKYPSGYYFDYKDIISDENIELVLKNSDEFKGVVLTDFNNDTITISETTIISSTTEITNRTFSISVQGSLFENSTEAATFVESLVSQANDKILNSVDDLSFSTYLNNAKQAQTFELQLNLLNQQVSYVSNLYNNLIDEFGDVTINGNTLLNYKTQYSSYFTINSISNLIQELNNNVYVKDYETNLNYLNTSKGILDNEITILEDQIAALDEKVTTLLGDRNDVSNAYPDIDSYNKEIAALTLELVTKQHDSLMLGNKINSGNSQEATVESQEFNSRVEIIEEDLEGFIDEYVEIVKGVYHQFSYVNFSNRAIVTSSGTVSYLLAGMVGAVMAGGISCVLFIVIDLTKKEEKEENLNN